MPSTTVSRYGNLGKSVESLKNNIGQTLHDIQQAGKTFNDEVVKPVKDAYTDIKKSVDVLKEGASVITTLVDDCIGDTSVESLANATSKFDGNWDEFAKKFNEKFGSASSGSQTNILETFAREHFGDKVFEAGSIVKKESPKILGGISDIKKNLNKITGNHCDPITAARNIKDGVDGIVKAINKIDGSVDNVFSRVTTQLGVNAGALTFLQGKLHSIISDFPNDHPLITESYNRLGFGINTLDAGRALVMAMVSDSHGKTTPQSLQKLASDFNKGWDNFAKEFNSTFRGLTSENQGNILETFAKNAFGQNVFYAGSAIKNGMPGVLGGVSAFKAAVDGFGGSYRDPLTAARKIHDGVENIVKATERIASSINGMAKTWNKRNTPDNPQGIPILETLSDIKNTPMVKNLMTVLKVGADGIEMTNFAGVAIEKFKSGDLKGAMKEAKSAYKKASDIFHDIKDRDKNVAKGNASNFSADENKNKETEKENEKDPNDTDNTSMDRSDSYVCSTATMRCTFGDRTARLTVYPDRTVFLTGKPMANITDHISKVNIAPFGKCHTTIFPSTGAATAAAHGKLTPMPCIPGTVTDWLQGKNDYTIKGAPALLKSSYCRCCYGGIITIINDGQTDTEAADLTKEGKLSKEEMQANSNDINAESVLDGIQLALDAAGFAPGVGAIPDLLNAAISALRGNWAEAGLSVLAAVPLVGDAAAGAKLASKGLKAVKNINKARKVDLAKKAKTFVSKNITKEQLLEKGICKSEKEVDFFLKSLRKERRNFAYDFYKKNGMPTDKISGHINGIDLNNAVIVKKMPPPKELIRFNDPGKEIGGSYYGVSTRTGDVINTPRMYGIQPVTVKQGDNFSMVVRKRKSTYNISDDVPTFEYLETTARPIKAPLNNDWNSIKDGVLNVLNKKTGKYRMNWTDTKGGAIQAYIPLKCQEYIKLVK